MPIKAFIEFVTFTDNINTKNICKKNQKEIAKDSSTKKSQKSALASYILCTYTYMYMYLFHMLNTYRFYHHFEQIANNL